MLAQSAGYLADAANGRVNDAFGSNGGGGADLTDVAESPQHGGALWAQVYGHAVSLDDTSSNAGDVSGNHLGVLGGIDSSVGNWVIGAAGGYSKGSFESDSRNSSGDVSSINAVVYAGGEAGLLRVNGGASYSFNQIDTTRMALGDTLVASYNAHTAQAFGEIGAKLGPIVPFVGANYINVATDAFEETGGPAALTADASDDGVTYTTVGVRVATDKMAGASLRAMAGWRHTFGDTAPLANLTIQGQSFTVAGVPIAENALVAEAGLDFDVTPNFTLSASYVGQISSDAQDHGGKGTATVHF